MDEQLENIAIARKNKRVGLITLISSAMIAAPIVIAGCLGYEPSRNILDNNFDTYCFVGGLASVGGIVLGGFVYAVAKGKLNYYLKVS